MSKTIEEDVPGDKVDKKIRLAKASGAISVEKIAQPNGRFTIIATFQDDEATDIAEPPPKIPAALPRKPVPPTRKPGPSPAASKSPPKTSIGPVTGTAPAEELILHPKIRAMLEVLAFAEGTDDDYGKVVNGIVIESPHNPSLIGRKNVSVSDFSRHPEIRVRVNAHLESTAAGRYQFLKNTWAGLGMPDFQPKSQDIAAVKLMKRRGMIEPLLNDDLHEAVFRGAREWASLPTRSGSSFFGGQPAKTIAEIDRKYLDALA